MRSHECCIGGKTCLRKSKELRKKSSIYITSWTETNRLEQDFNRLKRDFMTANDLLIERYNLYEPGYSAMTKTVITSIFQCFSDCLCAQGPAI